MNAEKPMKRRGFLIGGAAAMTAAAAGGTLARLARSLPAVGASAMARGADAEIPVAFLMGHHATMIDFAGPWEVFQDAESGGTTFRLYTVSDTAEPIPVSGGMRIIPDFTFEDAPPPRIVVVPAQGGRTEAKRAWLREVAGTAEVTMSVCTGAFVLGWAGLLEGRPATTHHDFFDDFEGQFPDVDLRRGVRFVESGPIATAGGLTSGIDLALRVVDRLLGREVARRTAEYMEYAGTGWIV